MIELSIPNWMNVIMKNFNQHVIACQTFYLLKDRTTYLPIYTDVRFFHWHFCSTFSPITFETDIF